MRAAPEPKTGGTPERAARRPRAWPLVVTTALWSSVVFLADVSLAIGAARQLHTRTYATTSAEVIPGPPTNLRYRNTILRGPTLAYSYVVGGETFQGHRVRALPTSPRAESAAAGAHVGERVAVFYAPENPRDAVLRPGLDAGDVFLVLFLLPFNAVALALLRAARRAARRSSPRDTTGGLRVVEVGWSTRVLPEIYGPAATAILWGGIVSFLLAVAGDYFFGFDPPARIAAADVAGVLAVAAIAYLDAAARRRVGAGELVIDGNARTIRFPLDQRGAFTEPIPWSAIEAVKVETKMVAWSTGTSGYYWVSAIRSERPRLRVRSTIWTDKDAAERFRGWLEAHIGLGGPPPAATVDRQA